MSKETVKALINAEIKTNGDGDITGAVLNNVLLEMVDLSGEGGAEGAVRYDESQTLTDTQKAQARTNINVYSKSEIDAMIVSTLNTAI